MKTCEKCGVEIWTKDGENLCGFCETAEANGEAKKLRRNKQRRERHAIMLACGLVRVRGALGGIYYE